MKPRTLPIALLLAVMTPLSVLRAQTVGTLQPLPGSPIPASYTVVPTGPVQPAPQIITWDGSNGIAINSLIGADTFYYAGGFGQGAVAANVEAGLVWNGHEMTSTVHDYYTAPGASGETDMHATWVGSVLAGYNPNADPNNYPYYQLGIAPFARLASGAIATNWYNAPDPVTGEQNIYFNITPKTFYSAYNYYFTNTWIHKINFGGFTLDILAPTDVINSSWGYNDPTATDPYTQALSGMARAHPLTTMVLAAGNSTTAGNIANNVGGPASGYNVISAGAVGDGSFSNFTGVSDFSSRGPQDYYDPVHGLIKGVRAPVDLVAPGTSMVAAFYGGRTGSNGPTLSTSGPDPSGGANDWYSFGLAGTSFAAPIVSGGVALLDSASYLTFMPNEARDARVIKAVLMNSATKLPGWDNGQHVNGSGVTVTTQALDWSQGAGMINLDRAFTQYLDLGQGVTTADASGGAATPGGAVRLIGWDYASISTSNDPLHPAHIDYTLPAVAGGSYMDVTLDWFRDYGDPVFTDNMDPNLQTLVTADEGMANLFLEIWNSSFTQLDAESMSLYNNVQELHFLVSADGTYGIRVEYASQMFGTPQPEVYGLAWYAVPLPGAVWGGLVLLTGWGVVALVRRRRCNQTKTYIEQTIPLDRRVGRE